MKVLVLGGDGQMGLCLKDVLMRSEHEVIFFSRRDIDVLNLDQAALKISSVHPSIVLNAAGYPAVDKAEREQALAMKLNSDSVANLAKVCLTIDACLVQLSTNYVFDGKAEDPYNETQKARPINMYGQSKLEGEQAIQASGCRHVIIRTSWIFSEYGTNFLKTVLKKMIQHYKNLNRF